jgi:uncharacterized protein
MMEVSMSAENVAVVLRCQQAWARGDLEAVRALLHPDLVIHEPPSLPIGGDHRGPEGNMALMARLAELWEFTSPLNVECFDGGDDRVFSRMRISVRSKKTGEEYDLDTIELDTVLDGKILDIRVFHWDTAAQLRALGEPH